MNKKYFYAGKMVIVVFLLCILFGVSNSGTTVDFTPSALKAMGAPNNPKVEVSWNRYYDAGQLYEIMRRIEKAYPSLAQVSSIGKSVEGKEMLLITVTNRMKKKPEQKPAMYIDGNIHSNEIQGSEVALYTAWYLCEMYGSNEAIRALVDEKTFYIIPTINPDARDYFIHQPNSPHSPRSGKSARDDDGDGLFDEDGPDDLDGDGNIVMMRKADPNGRWIADPDDPRLMIQAKPDQRGTYTMLGFEGFDNDGDGLVNEDPVGYYDPNRDWAWNWAPEYVQDGADRYPFSLPENRAVADFVLAHPNIAAAQTYHNNGGMILRSPGVKDDARIVTPADARTFDFLGKTGEEILPGYKYMVLYKDLYTVYGGEIDWFYAARGVLTFTNELFPNFEYFRKQREQNEEFWGGRRVPYRFDKLLLFEEGIVPWKKVPHPQYGEVEIGGFKKSWTRTAPSFQIEEMCHRNMAFTLFHAGAMPMLSVDTVIVKKIAGGMNEVTAVISNRNLIPTHTGVDLKNKISCSDLITLEGPKVVAGAILENLYTGTAEEQKKDPQTIKVENIPGMGAVYVRWIVDGGGPYTVTVRSEKGGEAVRSAR